jgi:outer membrane murein-binding lipoprotein Lpp
MRVAVTYATTLLIVGIGIWQDVYLAGQTAQQRAQTTSSTAQTVNSAVGVP